MTTATATPKPEQAEKVPAEIVEAVGVDYAIAQQFKGPRETIEEIKALDASMEFDYEDKTGNKDARSHRAKLSKVRAVINKAHKEAKAEALEYGRKVDKIKNELTGEVDNLINRHTVQLKKIEERQERQEAGLKKCGMVATCGTQRSNFLTLLRDEIAELDPEGCEALVTAKANALIEVEGMIQAAEKREKEEEELRQLRAEKREREEREAAEAEIERRAKEIADKKLAEAQQQAEEAKRQAAAETARREEAEKRLQQAEAEKPAPVVAPVVPVEHGVPATGRMEVIGHGSGGRSLLTPNLETQEAIEECRRGATTTGEDLFVDSGLTKLELLSCNAVQAMIDVLEIVEKGPARDHEKVKALRKAATALQQELEGGDVEL